MPIRRFGPERSAKAAAAQGDPPAAENRRRPAPVDSPTSNGRQHWTTRAELRAALFDYIEAFYSRARHQAGLGHLTPAESEDTRDAA